MAIVSSAPPARAFHPIPPLENGDHLTAKEFLRRYKAMPAVKKAELIQGIVSMASPVRSEQHGKPDALIQTWLGSYAALHPSVQHRVNTTLRLGPDEVPQPDGLLFRIPEAGGRCTVDSDGYLCGPPELVVEIAASSVSRDAREKLVSYCRVEIAEYLLWRVEDEVIEWFHLAEDEYQLLPANEFGVIESRMFPGLRLDVPAALRFDAAALLAGLSGD